MLYFMDFVENVVMSGEEIEFFFHSLICSPRFSAATKQFYVIKLTFEKAFLCVL